MSRKDFILIAETILGLDCVDNETRERIAEQFASRLAGTNEQFKKELFVQAATGQCPLMMDLDEIRLESGDLPAYAFPGGYPIVYVVADGGNLCAVCANGGNGSRAADKLDPDCPADAQWLIVGYQVEEGPEEEVQCDHCDTIIAFAWNELSDFTQGYIDCALWVPGDEAAEDHTFDDLDVSAVSRLIEDAKDFEEAHRSMLDVANILDRDDAHLGHDFWLTRNHHGAGFWDRGLGVVGEQLTDAAHAYGEADLYMGDDGKVYHA